MGTCARSTLDGQLVPGVRLPPSFVHAHDTPPTLASLFSRHFAARGHRIAFGGDSTTMYLAHTVAGLRSRFKNTPLWRLKREVLKQDLPWLAASRENSWDALLRYPLASVLNWTRWGLTSGGAPDVVVLHAGIWCLHMHPWWTWKKEWRTPQRTSRGDLAPSQKLLLDPTCCGRERYRHRMELMVRQVRQVAPHALVVLKTANAMCEEAWLASTKRQEMALGEGVLFMSAYESALAERAGSEASANELAHVKSAARRRWMASRLASAAQDAERKVGLSEADYRSFFYRRAGVQAQREVVYEVAAAHERVRVLDAFAITAEAGCLDTFDGVHYSERTRARLGLELLDLALCELRNETLATAVRSAAASVDPSIKPHPIPP